MKAWGSVPRGRTGGFQTVVVTKAMMNKIAAVNYPTIAAKSTAASASLGGMITSAASGLARSLKRIKSNYFLLLMTTSIVPDLCGAMKASFIPGFLATRNLAVTNSMN